MLFHSDFLVFFQTNIVKPPSKSGVKDRRVTQWAMAAFYFPKTAPTMVARNHNSLFITQVKLWSNTNSLKVWDKARQENLDDIRYPNNSSELPSPNISLISVLFHSIATTYNHRN